MTPFDWITLVVVPSVLLLWTGFDYLAKSELGIYDDRWLEDPDPPDGAEGDFCELHHKEERQKVRIPLLARAFREAHMRPLPDADLDGSLPVAEWSDCPRPWVSSYLRIRRGVFGRLETKRVTISVLSAVAIVRVAFGQSLQIPL